MAVTPLTPEMLMDKIPGMESVEARLGVGGFKEVYRIAVQGRPEALKVLIMQDSRDPDFREAFLHEQLARVRREIEALSKCRRPELVKLGSIPLQSFEAGGRNYMAYSEEFLPGRNLWDLLRTRPDRPALGELLALFHALLNCVEELWGLGYVHRDIKPHNVMNTGDAERQFVLLDLGIAYAVREASLTFQPDDRLVATARYVAPEMLEADFRNRIDFRTDLYGTGLTVYEYAAGMHPLARDSDDLIRTISRALRQPPTPLEHHRTDLPEAFCEVVNSLLKKKPALRPASLSLIRQKLEGPQ